jgi:hypothetical protein
MRVIISKVNGKAFIFTRVLDRNTDTSNRSHHVKSSSINNEAAEKELHDTSCRGTGGVSQLLKSPKIGGYRRLIKSISAVS